MPSHPERHQPSPDGYTFTENEKLFSRVSDARFREMVFDNGTTIHSARIDGNNYGEFCFVTVSRSKGQGREAYTFWGAGFHEPRDRWIIKEWFFHRANQFPALMKRRVLPEDVEDLIRERQEAILPVAEKHRQSLHGQLFEDLAELADDDGIMAEMDDMEGLFGALYDDSE